MSPLRPRRPWYRIFALGRLAPRSGVLPSIVDFTTKIAAYTHLDARTVAEAGRGAMLMTAAYYLGARFGFALQSPGVPQSILWLPNAILLSALLLAPTAHWPTYFLAAFPAQVAVGAHVHAPMLPITLLYLTNCLDAGLGAYLVRRFAGRRLALNQLRQMLVFLLLGATFATLLVTFADAAVTVLTGWSSNYWLAWTTRARANLLTNIVFVPTVIGLTEALRPGWRSIPRRSIVQAILLLLATLVLSHLIFTSSTLQRSPAILYAPVPILLIGAVQFGVGVCGLQLLIIAIVASWSVMRGAPVFTDASITEDIMGVQLFLFSASVPLLCLAAVVRERRATALALRASERRVRRQFARLSTIYRSTPVGLAFVDQHMRVVSANRQMISLSGGTRDSARSRTLSGTLPLVASQLESLLARTVATGKAIVNHEIVVSRKAAPGEPLEFLLTCDPVRDASDAIIGANIVLQDITERKRAEQALRESREELRKSYSRRLDLAGRMISAQEVERRRIARELHDDFSQRLAEMAIAFGSLRNQLANSRASVRAELTQLRQWSSELAVAMRDLSHDLHPAVLEHAGLVAALQARCEEFAQQRGIEVRCKVEEVGAISDDVALCLYRVTQEALSNIVRHANAKVVQIDLTRRFSLLELSITDDGRGFDTSRAFKNVGLFSVDERVRLINGTVTIQSTTGAGTVLRAIVPVPEPASITDRG